jgi:hypothetical protein
MTEQLSALLKRLNRLSYDELIAFANKLEHDLAEPLRAHADLDVRMKGERIQKMIRQSHRGTSLEKIRKHLRAINEEIHFAQLLTEDEQQIAVQMARTLQQALQPVEGRRKPRKRTNQATGMIEEMPNGRVEIKYIRVPVYDIQTGDRLRDEQDRPLSRGAGHVRGYAPEIPGYGPYVYVRVWATGGGKERDEKRLKSRYVGTSGLAASFLKMEPGSEERQIVAKEILDLYVAGGSKAVRAWAAEYFPDPDAEELDESEVTPEDEALPPAAHTSPPPDTSDKLKPYNLPFQDKQLSKERRALLFQFFADEYQKRHKRPWRFYEGTLVALANGKYRLVYKLWKDDVSVRSMQWTSRREMERDMLWIINEAGDLTMTLER